MKELKLKDDVNIEISVKKKQQKEKEFIGTIIPHEGHTIYQINDETLEIEKAKFSNTTFIFGGENKKEILIMKGCTYVSALNKKNALKKYKKGLNGSKNINTDNFIPLSNF
jgi:predicted nuclease with TOPRIM domain